MHAKLTTLTIMSLTGIMVLGALAVSCTIPSASTFGGSSEATDRANVEFARAIAAVREAEGAGAQEDQLRVLIEKLNSAVWMIDRAERLLLQGDIIEAAAQADRSVEISKGVAMEAVKLRDEASQRTYYGKTLTFGMVPVASLLVTVGSYFGWKWWRRREIDRMMRMEIKGLKESEEGI